jgi:hypothetical protein
VLDDNVMLNAQDQLILNNGELVNGSTLSTRNFAKFLRFFGSPDGIVYGISAQDILIKDSYLLMIEKIENDREDEVTKGCTIIGSPGIGKTHFSLYIAFYLTRRYTSTNIIYQQPSGEGATVTLYIGQQNRSVIKFPRGLGGEDPEVTKNSFYIADSIVPSLCKTIYTFLVTTPKNVRWHEFKKYNPRKYYAPIWTEKEIWDVWEWNSQYKEKIPKARVEELIRRWGCIPRRVFVEYDDEPDLFEFISQCDTFTFLRGEGGDYNDNYTGKAIHIIPSSDFMERKFVPASEEIFEALYKHYENNTKDRIIEIIKNFSRTVGGPLSGRFFEMVAHDVLRKGGKFKVRCLANNDKNDLDLQELEFKYFDEIHEITPGCYNVPKDPNFNSIDSLAPNRNGSNHLYQTTIAEKHDINVMLVFISLVLFYYY